MFSTCTIITIYHFSILKKNSIFFLGFTFSALKGCFGRILGLLGMLLCFDPTHYPKFGIGFWLGNEGNLDLCSS